MLQYWDTLWKEMASVMAGFRVRNGQADGVAGKSI
jgi:hypothetical protein